MEVSKTHWIAMGLAIAACCIFWAYVMLAADALPWFTPAIIATGFVLAIWFWSKAKLHS